MNQYREQKRQEFLAKFPKALYIDVPDRVAKATDWDLLSIWRCLRNYDPSQTVTQGWETVSMDDWAEAVYIELTRRGLSTN